MGAVSRPGLGAGALLFIQRPRDILVDLPRDFYTFLRGHGLANLLRNLLLDIDGVLDADGARELSALLPWNIDGDIGAFLLGYIFTFSSWHLFLYFLWYLLTLLFGNLHRK